MQRNPLHLALALLLALLALPSAGQSLDTLRSRLLDASRSRVQEKVFVHTDNTCYFLGDTLWYKAYVVRADDLRYTDMSRLLYVELLSPDGLVVERQTVVVSDNGYGSGQFALTDTLFSGYYELRAYTRWMLNFNVREKKYRRDDAHLFYNNEMAADFFRQWDGLYSRVFPVYAKPGTPGDYDCKRIARRPRQNPPKALKPGLRATFFPEGGHLVKGVPNRVAFELTDEQGQAASARGTVTQDGGKAVSIAPTYMGRGTFTVTPAAASLKAVFSWKGKTYTFALPKAEDTGMALRLDGRQLTLSARGLPAGADYGLSVLCRGTLRHFQTVRLQPGGTLTVRLPSNLPTGVNDVTLFTAGGLPLADRLFFVNNHDYDESPLTVDADTRRVYAPYSPVTLNLTLKGASAPELFSLAVRDSRTDEPTYDTGNMMTDLLLGSELRGFVADPGYYFARPEKPADATERQRAEALDLLMMVQGWRKYDWQSLAQPADTLRYKPETTLTLEGRVYKTVDINPVEPDEIEQWQYGMGYSGIDSVESADTNAASANGLTLTRITLANDMAGVNHRPMKREVMVEAELAVGGKFVGSAQKTHGGGRFLFEIPPFYGTAILNMKAYKANDSIKKNMLSLKDTKKLDETQWPDYYVKRDIFYPVFPQPYSYYQNHAPDFAVPAVPDTLSRLSMENDMHVLSNIDVKGHRRGRRGINFSKPVFTADAYDLYNLVTDYGLSYGYFDMRQFPVQAARVLFGNMNLPVSFNVDAWVDSTIFYRSYVPDTNEARGYLNNRNLRALHETFHLKRLSELRFFTDFNLRDEGAYADHSSLRADVTVEFVPFANDAVQPSFRDRHGYVDGITVPATFYQPDYSNRQPGAPADYRRTLYWNPNARTDSSGRLSVTFYNNSRPTRIRVSAAGLTSDGRIVR